MTRILEEEVWYRHGEISLAGALLLPPATQPSPGVVFVHGSGQSDRTNRWYRAIADHLVSRGIVVLLPDKRGSGQSGGDWRTADFHDLAGDVLTGVALLRGREEVNPDHLGLVAVSQGGSVAPLVATQSPNVGFVAVLSGSAVTPRESFRHENRQDFIEMGFPGWFARLVFPISQLLLRRRWPRWPDVETFDPIPLWERVTIPVLFANGEEDANVPVRESVARLEVMIQRTQASNFTIRVYPGSGHGLFEPGTRALREDFLEDLASWILDESAAATG